MVVGLPKKEDPGMIMLISYDKKHLIEFNKNFKQIGNDLLEMEKNFLEGITYI